MAALIDEYKQAIQDVLDGRAKPAPKPSELPWTEDKLASMWAAAAAELIAEDSAGGDSSLPADPAQDGTYNLQNTVDGGTGTLSWASGSSGGGVLVVNDVEGTLDKTWQEIADAGFAVCYVQPPIPVMPTSVYVLCSIKDDEDEPSVQFYCASASGDNQIRQYAATSKNGYPAVVED